MTADRPVRILLAILGLDQHEAGAFAVARLLRDAGMEVIYLGRFGTPDSVVGAALEEGVDVIGLSCHSWEYLYYLDELLQLMKSDELDIPVVVGGSVLSQDDKAAVEEFARNDPYVINGVVTDWIVRQWMVVVPED